MQGYPKHIATKQDYENLLSMEEYKEQALVDLRELAAFDDRYVTRAIKPLNHDDPMREWETEVIDNPYPLHAQKGFIDKDEKEEKAQISNGWYKIPKLIAVVEKRKYEDVLTEFEKVKPEPIKKEDNKPVEGEL